jgi:hypothetical protein
MEENPFREADLGSGPEPLKEIADFPGTVLDQPERMFRGLQSIVSGTRDVVLKRTPENFAGGFGNGVVAGIFQKRE